jgi:hypothetical protein
MQLVNIQEIKKNENNPKQRIIKKIISLNNWLSMEKRTINLRCMWQEYCLINIRNE